MNNFRGGFGGGFGGANLQNLMRQAQKMQEDMQKAQALLEETEIVGSAAGGLVTVTMNAKKVVSAINISKDAVDTDDMSMLEDIIVAALNDGYAKADKLYQEKMGAFGQLGL